MIGREISHYRVLERLGGGGMGEVFKAEDLRLERRVALKFLPPELGEDPVTKERFVQEAKAASALDHPNLCTIHDIDETEKGRLFIAMTLYEGETLKKRLAGGPLAVDEALEIAEQVGEGLIKAHGEGITHRDIKPANLMITRDGVVKIVDFGLAKLAGDPGLTKTGASVGTPAYMSPEQARGADTDQSLPEIAEELGAEAILEGSVRRAGNQIRVVAQLIDAREDAHLWTETYDRELTVENVFAIQSDIAGRISSALQAEFTSEEERRIRSPPTEDLEAYDYYLRGVDFLHRSWTERDNRIAIEMFEQATQLDPEFARAWAKLSEAHSRMYWYPFDRSRERLRRAKRAADRSLELEPDLPEGHQALGFYHYWGHLDYQKALEHFEAALRRQPGNSELLMAMGAVERRRGNLQETLSRYESALDFDPRGLDIHAELAVTHRLLRNYSTAERHFDRALAISPDRPSLYGFKAGLYLLWKGDTSEARRVLERAVARGLEIADDRYAGYQWVLVALLDREYETALERLSSGSSNAFSTQYFYIPEPLLASQVYDLMGSRKAAREQYASAAAVLESRIQESPEDARLHGALGIAYAGLGRAEEAIRTGEKGVELLPVSVEAWKGLYRVEELALIYTMTGRLDEAIEQLEYLLSVPAEVSVPLLRLDPRWDPLRDHPRFQALLERHE